MARPTSVTLWAGATAGALVTTLALSSPSSAADPPPPAPTPKAATAPVAPPDDMRHVGPDYSGGKTLPLDTSGSGRTMRRMAPSATAAAPEVGDSRTWLALDDTDGSVYPKSYTLRGLGRNIQVWVADDRAFPEGDCRNTLGLTQVTDAQVRGFVREFDSNIYPVESRAFSTPPDRDGTGGADLAGQLGLPEDYWKVPAEQSDDIVTLVDNVRDANFYAPNTPDGQTYIGGFFDSGFNEYLDRNVMTIDAYDWLHRTGASPKDDSAKPEYVACATALGQTPGGSGNIGSPRVRGYEGTFAHEYQHLLESYEDPDETNWINEGLSDWAQTLVGYVDPRLSPDHPEADGHISCFQGFEDPKFGGPENSLTRWGDQGGPEILCDYGAAYTLMEYLQSHYGNAFMKALHRDDRNGLDSLDNVLSWFGAGVSAQETLHRWAASAALDQVLDRNSGSLQGGDPSSFTARTLSSKINWGNNQAYDSPGAPANGSDYVRLRSSKGAWLSSGQIGTIGFRGARTLEPAPVEWTTDANPPTQVEESTTCGEVTPGSGPAALHSGCGDDLDRSLVRKVTVPAAGGSLTFDALWDIEEGWDFGYAQVSADGGKTWQSLPTADTTSEHDPAAQANIVDNLPGFTGESGGWRSQTASLNAWKGKQILVGFRYLTDSAATEAGMWVRNIKAAGTTLPTSLDGWQTITQASPLPVSGWTVQLVAHDTKGTAYIHRLRLNSKFEGGLTGRWVRALLGKKSGTVAAIVTYDDPTESAAQNARYRLVVNGKTQPGG